MLSFLRISSVVLAGGLTLGSACSSAAPHGTAVSRRPPSEAKAAPPAVGASVAQPGKYLVLLESDRARYAPGETARLRCTFAASPPVGASLWVRYRRLVDVVETRRVPLTTGATEWTWRVPMRDFTGYLAELLLEGPDGTVLDQVTLGVDVSSDWSRFPRYGYLAEFPVLTESAMSAVIARLNRFHLNGVQFYDWQWKHHRPLPLHDGEPDPSWKDVANREVSLATVRAYIEKLHARGIFATNYNLLYGAFAHADVDGVLPEWGLYADRQHTQPSFHPLPASWASHLYLQNPDHAEWRRYLFAAESEVRRHLAFDALHFDQLGSRGVVYDWDGHEVDLASTFGAALDDASRVTGQRVVMNAVDQFGQASIAKSPVEFLYTEVWPSNGERRGYGRLKDVVDENLRLSDGKKATVVAGYLNYDLANAEGTFNAPGVLLADAVLFAAGGSHLELGESLLAKEYFPNRNLQIPRALEQALVAYYDFLVAYQNLLRDGLVDADLRVVSTSARIATRPELGAIWTLAKSGAGVHVVHLLNFTGASHLDWNDAQGTQAEPARLEQVALTLDVAKPIRRAWVASPDSAGGAPLSVSFVQEGERATLSVPTLKYWTMLVVETDD